MFSPDLRVPEYAESLTRRRRRSGVGSRRPVLVAPGETGLRDALPAGFPDIFAGHRRRPVHRHRRRDLVPGSGVRRPARRSGSPAQGTTGHRAVPAAARPGRPSARTASLDRRGVLRLRARPTGVPVLRIHPRPITPGQEPPAGEPVCAQDAGRDVPHRLDSCPTGRRRVAALVRTLDSRPARRGEHRADSGVPAPAGRGPRRRRCPARPDRVCPVQSRPEPGRNPERLLGVPTLAHARGRTDRLPPTEQRMVDRADRAK